jgi:hypothetical protein
MPLTITHFALTTTNSITSNTPFTVAYTTNTTSTTDYRLNFASQTMTNSMLITGSGNHITATSPFTAGLYTVTLSIDYNGVSAITSTLMTVTSPPPTPTVFIPETPTNTPKPVTPTSVITTNIPTPFPMLPAVYIEDCDGHFIIDGEDKTDTMCASSDANPTSDTSQWKLRWKFNSTVTIPTGWYYSLRFFKSDRNKPVHTIRVDPNQMQNEVNWLVYPFNVGTLQGEDGCHPYWDVIVDVPKNLVNCPENRVYGDICQLTEFPDRQRGLGTDNGSCPGGSGGSSQGGSTDRPPPPD